MYAGCDTVESYQIKDYDEFELIGLPEKPRPVKDNKNDKSIIKERFTIERKYGKVIFEGVVDISGIDIDSIVKFTKGSFEIYPGGVPKPPIGQGLNVPAIVELYDIFPPAIKNKNARDKSHRSKQDEKQKHIHKFVNGLKKIISQNNGKFVGYDAKNGILTLKHIPS